MSRACDFEVRRFAELGSTNTYLLEQARAGAPEGVVAVADHQTEGRGRLGRSWEAPPGGSLLVSVLLRPTLGPGDLHLCPALVALAAVEACGQVAGVHPSVKWPNDLLIDGRKVAGVLAEADPDAPGGDPGAVAVVVGLGCNLSWPGPDPKRSTSLDAAAGRPVDGERLLATLLNGVAARRRALDSAPGRSSLAGELEARCETVGQEVRVDLARSSFVGKAVGLTSSGHLVVETTEGPRTVAAGDVVHLRSPGDGGGAN